MPQLCDTSLCTACGACVNACPADAITWRTNNRGEELPHIDTEKCLDCKACERVCPQLFELRGNLPNKACGCWLHSAEERGKSSSGGAARALSQTILDRGGVVFGCAFSDGRNHHKAVRSIAELDELSGSKYLWSDVEHSYREVKRILQKDSTVPVLFIGTPCQVDGLKRFLGNSADSPQLFTADLICHGTPPPAYVREFLRETEGDEPERLVCRDKNGFAMRGRLKNGHEFYYSGSLDCSLYLQAYIRGIPYRERCYTCRYATRTRVGDITLGDYWGIPRNLLPQDSPELVSIVYLNTPQGDALFEKAQPLLNSHPIPATVAIGGKSNMLRPQIRPFMRDVFLKALPKVGFTKAARKALRSEHTLSAFLRRVPRAVVKRLRKLFRGYSPSVPKA